MKDVNQKVATLIPLGSQFPRWVRLKKSRGFTQHNGVAKFLLDLYEAHLELLDEGCPLLGMLAQPPEILYISSSDYEQKLEKAGQQYLDHMTGKTTDILPVKNVEEDDQIANLNIPPALLYKEPMPEEETPQEKLIDPVVGDDDDNNILLKANVGDFPEGTTIVFEDEHGHTELLTGEQAEQALEFQAQVMSQQALAESDVLAHTVKQEKEEDMQTDQALTQQVPDQAMVLMDSSAIDGKTEDGAMNQRLIVVDEHGNEVDSTFLMQTDENGQAIHSAIIMRGEDGQEYIVEGEAAREMQAAMLLQEAGLDPTGQQMQMQVQVKPDVEDAGVDDIDDPDWNEDDDDDRPKKITRFNLPRLHGEDEDGIQSRKSRIYNPNRKSRESSLNIVDSLIAPHDPATVTVAIDNGVEVIRTIPAPKEAVQILPEVAVEDLPDHRTLQKDMEGRWACNTCGKTFKAKQSLRVHWRTHTREKPFPCPLCTKRFQRNALLTVHMRKKHEDSPTYRCMICNKMFFMQDEYEAHKASHKDRGREYLCTYCAKTFAEHANLLRHMRIHVDGNIFQCDECRMSFKEEWQLEEHMRRHRGETPHCPICNKSFSAATNLTKHIARHSAEKNFKCEVCNRTFAVQSDLQQHSRVHSVRKVWECHVCGKTFKTPSYIREHMRLHRGEKSLSCSVCNKTFSFRCNLIKHMRLHTGEKPYKCKFCNKEFADKTAATVHERLHTGEKPYQCSACNKTFASRTQAAKHIRTHGKKIEFVCPDCGEGFTQKSSLQTHLKEHGY